MNRCCVFGEKVLLRTQLCPSVTWYFFSFLTFVDVHKNTGRTRSTHWPETLVLRVLGLFCCTA